LEFSTLGYRTKEVGGRVLEIYRHSGSNMQGAPSPRSRAMAGKKRTYTIILAEPIGAMPADTLHELRLTLKEIGEACDGIIATNPFWKSVAGSDLVLDVGPWRFVYAIEGGARTIIVKDCKRLR